MPPSRTPERWSTGKWIAAILAVAVHLGFIVFLIFSVTWQNSKPEAVSVELYAPPGPERIVPTPAPEPPKPAPEPPKPAPEPPKPAPEPPRPAPKIEPPQPTKADIALKEKQERERKQKEEKDRKDIEKREADKRDAEQKKLEEKRLAEIRDRQARETAALKAQSDRERVTAQQSANDAYIRSIQAKIKGNVLVPPDIAGNPEAIFDVVQLPTGEIIDAQLRKSSGVKAYDEAVQRAIIKSSPLPKPATADLFQRSLTLRFRPVDQ
jgi:colicin import membrane protein